MRSGSVKSTFMVAVLSLACALVPNTSVRADAVDDKVVATVGDQVLTVRDVERRLAFVPPFRLRMFGNTPDEIRKNFVERVLVQELLFSQGAEANKFADKPEIQPRIRRILRDAAVASLRNDIPPVTDEEIRAFYQANLDKFHTPQRITIWRILVDKRADAEGVIAELKQETKTESLLKLWDKLVRERSIDKATNMRKGNLGAVTPDGHATELDIKIDSRVLLAANSVKDGEIVFEPVPDGDRFSVIWRRQTMNAVHRTLEQEALGIRRTLEHQKIDAKVKELIDNLRKQRLQAYTPELVDLIDITSTGDLQPVRRPGTLPTSRRPGSAPPSPVPDSHDHR